MPLIPSTGDRDRLLASLKLDAAGVRSGRAAVGQDLRVFKGVRELLDLRQGDRIWLIGLPVEIAQWAKRMQASHPEEAIQYDPWRGEPLARTSRWIISNPMFVPMQQDLQSIRAVVLQSALNLARYPELKHLLHSGTSKFSESLDILVAMSPDKPTVSVKAVTEDPHELENDGPVCA